MTDRLEQIASRDTSGWMQKVDMSRAVDFGMKGPLHHKRPRMTTAD
jgi:hypothetical protein